MRQIIFFLFFFDSIFLNLEFIYLINNFQSETEAVLRFLNLQWEPEMEKYQNTALKRGYIKTPSYSQVVQPIYKDAQYRWLNYRKHLEQYLDQLHPWILDFGYGETL